MTTPVTRTIVEWLKSIRRERGSVWLLFEEIHEQFPGLSAKQMQTKMDYLAKNCKDGKVQKDGVGKAARFRWVSGDPWSNKSQRVNATIDEDMEVDSTAPVHESTGMTDAEEMRAEMEGFDAVPTAEPLAQFRVLGSLVNGVDFKGTVLRAESNGFNGLYLLTELGR